MERDNNDKSRDVKNENDRKAYSDIIIGRNAVQEAVKANRPIDSILVSRGAKSGSIGKLIAQARDIDIPIKEVDSKKLDFMSGHGNHQGIVAVAAIKEYAELDDIFALASERHEKPFIIICDELEDPHNLGAIIRTAECAGAHGVIIPKRRNVGLTYSVGKASAGAIEYVPVVRAGNLADMIDKLKEKGLWIYAADMDGQPWCDTDYSGAVGLVIGSEGKGVGRLIREKSDFIVSLPMKGQISSLNASVAAGVISYEISRQRNGIRAINP